MLCCLYKESKAEEENMCLILFYSVVRVIAQQASTLPEFYRQYHLGFLKPEPLKSPLTTEE